MPSGTSPSRKAAADGTHCTVQPASTGCFFHSSIAAPQPRPGGAPYAAAKAALSQYTTSQALALAPDRIRVNAVSPGVITTPFHERFSTPEQLATMQATIPMKRLGASEDCAAAFLYLASEAASGYVTGQMVEINGGQSMP